MNYWMCLNGVWVNGVGAPIRTAPIQRVQSLTGGGWIPYEVVEEAYKEYSAQCGTDQSLERLNERGGFGAEELSILLYERCKRLSK